MRVSPASGYRKDCKFVKNTCDKPSTHPLMDDDYTDRAVIAHLLYPDDVIVEIKVGNVVIIRVSVDMIDSQDDH